MATYTPSAFALQRGYGPIETAVALGVPLPEQVRQQMIDSLGGGFFAKIRIGKTDQDLWNAFVAHVQHVENGPDLLTDKLLPALSIGIFTAGVGAAFAAPAAGSTGGAVASGGASTITAGDFGMAAAEVEAGAGAGLGIGQAATVAAGTGTAVSAGTGLSVASLASSFIQKGISLFAGKAIEPNSSAPGNTASSIYQGHSVDDSAPSGGFLSGSSGGTITLPPVASVTPYVIGALLVAIVITAIGFIRR